MKNTITKPIFKEVAGITIMKFPEDNLIFNAQRVGPMNFNGLRNADYGKGFRMPLASELIPLVYTPLKNKDCETANNIIKTMNDFMLTGNTAAHYFSKGLFVEDNPEMKDGKIIIPDYKALEKKLGKHKERGVVFSDDKSIRFTHYNYQREYQSDLDLSKNTGVIALFGGEENAKKLTMSPEHYKLKPYFWALSNVNSSTTRVVCLSFSRILGGVLQIDGGSSGDSERGCVFGVLEKYAEGVATKK